MIIEGSCSPLLHRGGGGGVYGISPSSVKGFSVHVFNFSSPLQFNLAATEIKK